MIVNDTVTVGEAFLTIGEGDGINIITKDKAG